MAIQILHYEFLGPIPLDDWGPPMEKIIYILFAKVKNGFNPIYVDQIEKTDQNDFFINNEKFKCWIEKAGNEQSLHLAIHLMEDSEENDRKRVVDKIISHYKKLGIKSSISSIVIVYVKQVNEVISPLYDLGYTEDEIKTKWKKYYLSL